MTVSRISTIDSRDPTGLISAPGSTWWWKAPWIVLVWALLFGLRLLGPDDLMDKDQENPAAYVQDAVINGNWVVQTDLSGDISSKPPLYTWLAALTTMASGRISAFTLYLAPGLATLGVALLLAWIGSRHWGNQTGLVVALVYLVSAVAAKQMALARTDGVFALTVTVTALLAYRSWTTGKGWTWFWVAAAVSTLAKGPAGLVFASGGLLACFWERGCCRRARPEGAVRSGDPHPALTGHPLPGGEGSRLAGSGSAPGRVLWCGHLLGVVLYLVIVVGWFAAAWLDMGQPVIDKMIHRELLGHATGSTTGRIPGSQFYKPPLLFVARYAPWSLLAFVGFWRVWRQPAAAGSERAFERFLFCWFWVGLAVLGLGAHHRGDLLNPMIPAAALLAGREVSRWLDRLRPGASRWALAGVTLVGVTLIAGKYYLLRPVDRYVKQTSEVKALAATLEAEVGAAFPFTHLGTPYGLQIYLDTLHRAASVERTARLLQGEAAAFVWVGDTIDSGRLTNGPAPVHTLMEVDLTERPGLRLLGNRLALAWEDDLAVCLGPLHVRMAGVRPRRLADRQMVFEPVVGRESGWVEVTNESESPREVRVRFGAREEWRRRVLAPDEVWRIEIGEP